MTETSRVNEKPDKQDVRTNIENKLLKIYLIEYIKNITVYSIIEVKKNI